MKEALPSGGWLRETIYNVTSVTQQPSLFSRVAVVVLYNDRNGNLTNLNRYT